MYRQRHHLICGPAVTSAATSVGPGRISKSPTLLPVERSRRAIVALQVAVRLAVITNWNAWVFGIRNMFDGTSLSSSRAFADTSTHWFDTLTARAGYLIAPNFLFYVQGGAAWTNTKVTFFDVNG